MANIFKELNKKQREIVKKVYGLKTETEVNEWQSDPKNIYKKNNVIRGKVTKESIGEGVINPNKIVVSAEGVPSFPNKKIKNEFINDLKEKFKSPLSRSKYTNEYFSKNYPITIKQVQRLIPYLAKQKNLEYPSGRSPETEREFVKEKRKQTLFGKKGTSSLSFEGRLVRIKRNQDLDLAHRVAKNITQTTNTLGLDSPIINQVIIKPSEKLINDYYKTQKIIGKKILKEGQTPELLKELDDINSKIFAESLRTKGRVVGSILLPDKTGGLVSEFVGVNPKLSIDFGIFDQDIKSLEKEIGFKKFRGVKIGTPEFFKKLKMSGGNIEKANLFYNEILPSVLEYNKQNPFDPKDFEDLLNTKERQASILKAASKYRSDLVPALKNIFKKIPLSSATKLGGLAVATPLLLAATPSRAMTTTEEDKKLKTTEPQVAPVTEVADAKLADDIEYDDVRKVFVIKNNPEVKATQSDILYWLADNEILEDVKQVGTLAKDLAITAAAGSAAFALPDLKSTIQESRAAGQSPLKTAGSALAKGFYRLGSPLATAAFTTPQILDEETTTKDIVTDPFNYLGLATMETFGKKAGTIAAPAAAEAAGLGSFLKNYTSFKNVGEAVPGRFNTLLRLGLNPRTIAGASRFLGIPGLIASTGYTLYDYLTNKESE